MNRLENKNMDSRCKQAILKVIATIETEITSIEKEIDEHINSHPRIKNMVENIKSVKGMRYLTAIAVVAEMPSVDNFDNANSFCWLKS